MQLTFTHRAEPAARNGVVNGAQCADDAARALDDALVVARQQQRQSTRCNHDAPSFGLNGGTSTDGDRMCIVESNCVGHLLDLAQKPVARGGLVTKVVPSVLIADTGA